MVFSGQFDMSLSYKILILVLNFSLIHANFTPPICYHRNGTITPSIYAPCNQNTEFSMCCRTGGGTTDYCMPNGLCINTVQNPWVEIWRESCTDPTWKSPFCLKAFDGCSGVSQSFGREERAKTDCLRTRIWILWLLRVPMQMCTVVGRITLPVVMIRWQSLWNRHLDLL